MFNFLSKIFPAHTAYAHCDIPCGVYDPHNAQMAAHTVLRMTQLIDEIGKMNPSTGSVRASTELSRMSSLQAGSGQGKTKTEHDISRMTRVKEKHGELVEDELGTLENDYFKEEHYKKFPNLKGLIEEAVKFSIKTRQTIDPGASQMMLEAVMQIAEIFYKTKDLTPVRISSGYPTKGEIVSHK